MFKRVMVCVGVIGALGIASAQDINLRGKITDQSGNAVSGAIVSLAKQTLKDTTGDDGAYELKTVTAAKMPLLQPKQDNVILHEGGLAISLAEPSDVKVQMFDVNGALLKSEILPTMTTGFYRFNLAQNRTSTRLLLVKVSLGKTEMSFRYLPMQRGTFAAGAAGGQTDAWSGGRLAKLTAIDDTVKVMAEGFKEKAVAIVSYDMELDVKLDPEGNGFTGSAGCGKTVGNVNSTGTVTTVQGRGMYRIKFPANYDKDKPYRLIFAMHCMGASSQDIAGNNYRADGAYNYYGLGSLATDAILIAPEGNSGGTWNPGSDEQFFSDLLKKLKNDFCIDTSRVFVCGFSFGAMYSYALSLAYPEQIRAVACYAPANWNFDPQPTNRHIPVAYYQTTGTGDGLCKWINNDGNKTGGKYCLLQHVEDNGCDANQEIKLANSGTHVTTDFKGCDEGYPVKFSSFNGEHTAGESWIPQETWDFFKQF